MTSDEFTNLEIMLDVGAGHQIYVHDWGKTTAETPIFYIHGGPGSGCDDLDKKKFDPKTQRVIFHDQRGSGKSQPYASLDNNTTQDLIEDINKIADKLNINRFVLCGGSWGSTLSLAYGIDNPGKVAGMVLDGIFTASQAEINWLDNGGWKEFFPDTWQAYQASVPAEHKDNPTSYHFHQALKGDHETAKSSAYAYLSMELALLKLDDKYSPDKYEDFDPTNGLIEIHYLANKCFLEPNYILDNAHELTMPIYLVQGRYDMVCPPRTAYRLDQELPNSRLIWTISGHLRQYESKNIQKLLLGQLTGSL